MHHSVYYYSGKNVSLETITTPPAYDNVANNTLVVAGVANIGPCVGRESKHGLSCSLLAVPFDWQHDSSCREWLLQGALWAVLIRAGEEGKNTGPKHRAQ